MKRSTAVPLGLTALMAASLTGCADEPPPDNAAVCIDKKTELRVEDERCTDGGGGGGYGFFYFGGLNNGARYYVPAEGNSVRGTGGSLIKPPGPTATGISGHGGDVFKGSPTISRGGFGGRGGGGKGFGG